METKQCSICGENDKLKITHTLDCNHTYHYQCLFLTFKNMKTNRCPYCRSGSNYLPLLNGIRKVDISIHKIDGNFQNIPCSSIIQRGPNKGKPCGKNCHVGFDFCKMHVKRELKNSN